MIAAMSQPPAEVVNDVMDPARLAALAATLGLPLPDRVPPFWHWAYFWDARPPEALGRDGHPATGDGLIPDLGLPRRMWAGGALEAVGDLCPGRPATRISRRLSAERKTGRSGALGLVALEHVVEQGGRTVLRERQDLVYRAAPEAPPNGRPAPAPPQAGRAPVEEVRAFDPVTLFRFSALTFNGHRIHYDRDHARAVEGHRGLVVHGPLLALLLADLAARHGRGRSIRYRATAPLIEGETAAFCLDGPRAWVRGPDGRLCMEAEVA